jgi:DNA repair protein RecO (recombination protein O)
MLHKSLAIVLHSIKYGETSLIVTLYTQEMGRLSCIVSGVRTRKSKWSASFFQPLTILEIVFYYRENREVQRLKEATCFFYYDSIPFETLKSSIALYLSEVLNLTLREEENNSALFAFLCQSFQWLDMEKEGVANFHLWFMIHYARFLGILSVKNSYSDPFPADSEMLSWPGLSDELKMAWNSLVDSPTKPPHLQISKSGRNILLDLLVLHYSHHMDGFARIKSVEILREVFA